MLYVYIALLVPGCVLLLLASGEKTESEKKMSLFLPFLKAGKYLCKKKPVRRRNKAEEEILTFLHPGEDTGKNMDAYAYKRAGYLVCIYFITVLAACAACDGKENGALLPGDRLERREYQEGEEAVELIAQLGGQEKPVTVNISEREYTREELEERFQRMLPELDAEVKGGNADLDRVRTRLFFPEVMDGYPFTISWESGDYHLIHADGEVENQNVPDGGQPVRLRAVIRCGSFERDYIFYANVLPPSLTEQERLDALLQESLREADRESIEESCLTLPQRVDNRQVVWKEKKGLPGLEALAAGIAAAFALRAALDRELKKCMEKRERELRLEYPEIVSKLTLLIGAGMTVQAAFRKTAAQGKKDKGQAKAVYQEMLTACNELDAGVPESQVYMRFGRRCRLKEYRRLGTLLTQNLKKGTRGLLPRLAEETRSALQEKKAGALRMGEEAGTKLLLPMTGMLLFVMIVIIVPAFGSF